MRCVYLKCSSMHCQHLHSSQGFQSSLCRTLFTVGDLFLNIENDPGTIKFWSSSAFFLISLFGLFLLGENIFSLFGAYLDSGMSCSVQSSEILRFVFCIHFTFVAYLFWFLCVAGSLL